VGRGRGFCANKDCLPAFAKLRGGDGVFSILWPKQILSLLINRAAYRDSSPFILIEDPIISKEEKEAFQISYRDQLLILVFEIMF
jgi:hypothetical protein